jgi:uncharacterized RDD family membrane protein YckC
MSVERSRPRSPAARMLGAGARGAERLAGATGVDRAIEDAVEEAIVRALQSPAVERAITRVLIEQNAIERGVEKALTSDQLVDTIMKGLDSETADRVWEELLASPKVQMLVERIAEAPEVRAAIAQQGVGLITDMGRRLTKITERMDDAAERVAHRVARRGGDHEQETNQVGLITRGVAFAIDVGLISFALSFISGILASLVRALSGDSGDGVSAWGVLALGGGGFILGGAIFAMFWALIGQTPGMRLLSIHLDVDGTREIGLKRAIKRVFAIPLALIPLGAGFFAILFSPERRGWHDRIAGTQVLYDHDDLVAPWSRVSPDDAPAPGSGRR